MLAGIFALLLAPPVQTASPTREPIGPGDAVYDGCFGDQIEPAKLGPPRVDSTDPRSRIVRIRHTFLDRLRDRP